MKSRKDKILNIKKIKRQVKGITLIALVVTIIVLLILAGVALNLTIGQNGIFQRAEIAANTWRNAETNEQLALQEGADLIEGYLNGNGGNQDDDNPPSSGVTYVDTVPIPAGFYYVGGSKATGLVISDDREDAETFNESTKNNPVPADGLIGNQFVWVPVEKPDLFQRYDGYWNNGSGTTLQGVKDMCQEPASNAASWETTEYETMQTSVINNKGFYVARYEASEGTGESTGKVQSKAGAMPWVNIPWGTSMTEVGNSGAVYRAQNMYNDSEHAVTSTLIYGVQWDAIMNFIDSNYSNGDGTCNSFVSNSTGQGNYNESENTNSWKNKLTSCGSSDDYRVKNIYDLAGNVFEWTMEALSTDYRVIRGGLFVFSGSEGPVSFRFDIAPDSDGNDNIGFRVALYL